MDITEATRPDSGASSGAAPGTMVVLRSVRLRERVVFYTAAGSSVAPILTTVLPHLFFAKQPVAVLLGSLVCSVGSALNFIFFVRPGRVAVAATVQAAIVTVTYAMSVSFSGGIHSPFMIFAPLMPILVGFLAGRRGDWAIALFLVAFCFALAGFKDHLPPPQEVAGSDLAWVIQISAAVLSVACITWIYEAVTQLSESELRSAMERTAETSSFLDTVLSHIPMVVVVRNYKDGGRYSLINNAAKKMLGPISEGLLGKAVHEIVPLEQANDLLRVDQEVFQSGVARFTELENLPIMDTSKSFRTWKVPTYDKAGEPHLLIRISQDITEELSNKKALEQERAMRQQSAKLASLGEMAAGVAHEINNPLAIIMGNARMLKRFADQPEKHPDYVAAISAAGARIQKIVSGLKKFSRSNEAKDYQPHPLAAIVREVIVLTGASSRRNDVPVLTELTTEAQIICDEVEIEQVLVNLIHNAIDAVKNRSDKWVRVSLAEEAESLVLRVSDSGNGIPAATAARLFDPFFTTKPVGEGTGLGLSIAKGILDEHGASLALLPSEAHTTFEIRFKKAAKEGTRDAA